MFFDELVWETSLLSLIYSFLGELITGVFNVNAFCLNDKNCSLNRVIYAVPFSDMRAYRGKSIFCYFAAVSNIRKTKKLLERDSNYGLADYCKGNFFYF